MYQVHKHLLLCCIEHLLIYVIKLHEYLLFNFTRINLVREYKRKFINLNYLVHLLNIYLTRLISLYDIQV